MKTILYVFILTYLFASFSLADVINVPADVDSIQGGINLALPGDTVLVSEGTYYENINYRGKAITVASHFILDEDASHISKTIIDGSQPSNPDSGSVVYFFSGEDTSSVLCGFTITGGSGTALYEFDTRFGGGIAVLFSGARITSNIITLNTINGNSHEVFGVGIGYVSPDSNSYIIIEKNKIIHNTGNANGDFAFGGGVCMAGNGRLIDNEISYNSCISSYGEANGGGVKVASLHPNYLDIWEVLIKNNQITHNFVKGKKFSADHVGASGGGIVNHLNKVVIMGNKITHNELDVFGPGDEANGAGISLYRSANGSLISNNIISNNSIVGNVNSAGGGIRIANSMLPIINNIISGNSAQNGGGIELYGSSTTASIINNTVIQNNATNGGGLYKDSPSSATILNSIFWDNFAESDSQIAGMADIFYSDIQGGWQDEWNTNINADPAFADTMYHLSEASPCVDAGHDSSFFNDIEDDENLGFALWPALGTLRNDLGAYGGPHEYDPTELKEIIAFISYVEQEDIHFFRHYELKPNYPNPFNPITTIEFTLFRPEYITLKIYNILGAEIATLVSDNLKAGMHKYTFDGSKLASGVYYCRLEAGSFVQTRKMIYLK